jgi:hypothetical protein
MGLSLESMAIAMPAVTGHPNRVGFKGVLTIVDVASDKPPAGARGHRVLLTRCAAEAAIPSLLGMALDYAPALDRHDVRRKVGVITRAEIVGRGIEVNGFLYARDFPEIVEQIGKAGKSSFLDRPQTGGTFAAELRSAGRAGRPSPHKLGDGAGRLPSFARLESSTSLRAGGRDTRPSTSLGMSYEIADAQIQDIRASVWVLNKVTFTGAAILLREKAAYRATWIELEQ